MGFQTVQLKFFLYDCRFPKMYKAMPIKKETLRLNHDMLISHLTLTDITQHHFIIYTFQANGLFLSVHYIELRDTLYKPYLK